MLTCYQWLNPRSGCRDEETTDFTLFLIVLISISMYYFGNSNE